MPLEDTEYVESFRAPVTSRMSVTVQVTVYKCTVLIHTISVWSDLNICGSVHHA